MATSWYDKGLQSSGESDSTIAFVLADFMSPSNALVPALEAALFRLSESRYKLLFMVFVAF
jgi:hypothetical protein